MTKKVSSFWEAEKKQRENFQRGWLQQLAIETMQKKHQQDNDDEQQEQAQVPPAPPTMKIQ